MSEDSSFHRRSPSPDLETQVIEQSEGSPPLALGAPDDQDVLLLPLPQEAMKIPTFNGLIPVLHHALALLCSVTFPPFVLISTWLTLPAPGLFSLSLSAHSGKVAALQGRHVTVRESWSVCAYERGRLIVPRVERTLDN